MAFGKKKDDDKATGAPPASEATAEAAAEDEDAAAADSIMAEEQAETVDPIAAGLLAEEKAEAAGAGTDALLNMFQTTQMETEDLSVLIELAGEVEIDDLLENLGTVAAALGIALPSDDEEAA
jgi:hypothetical protein